MRKKGNFIRIICLVAVILFAMTACEGEVFYTEVARDGVMVGIVISKLPTKMLYDWDEEFDSAGMIVSAVYNDGSLFPVTDFEASRGRVGQQMNPPLETSGQSTVTVTYQGFMTTVTVSVYDSRVQPCATPTGTLNGTVIPPGNYNINRGATFVLETSQTEGGRIQIWYSVNGYGISRDGMRTYQYTAPLTLQPGMLNANNSAQLTIKTATVADGWHNSPEAMLVFTFLDF